MSTFIVTSSLLIGDLPPTISRAVAVATLEEALEVIGSRGMAVLPAGSWDLAVEVMTALGMDERTREDRLHFARTGRTLYAV